jgi:dihydropteroate synthase-like protein
MPERIALITGHLARARLEKAMIEIGSDAFDWVILDAGVKVAALMTERIIRRRISLPEGTTRVILPGRCRADLAELSRHFGVPVDRGPDEIIDLPAYFGRGARPLDLSRHDLCIFAEIVEASQLAPEAILDRARMLASKGADVIDLGGLPDTPFPHLEDSVHLLKHHGLRVSVDSSSVEELKCGARAGADFLLSLDEGTLDLAFDTNAVPILVPSTPGDLQSLLRAAQRMGEAGKPFIADPVLDPIHFGFTQSLARYAEFRRLMPQAEMLMGTGNLTELTDADSLGVTALLAGICSELAIRNVLVVQVSPHTRRTVEEHDAARRVMYAAKADNALPKGYGGAMLSLHDKRPFPNSPEQIAANVLQVRDPNFRIEVGSDGIHAYNNAVHAVGTDALAFFPELGVEIDSAHAFYLGGELAKAEIAWLLGKRYAQDEPLDFGCSADKPEEDTTAFKQAGPTRSAASGDAKRGGGA